MNVPLDDEHLYLVLLQLSIREGKSIPELLRPVIVGHLKRKVAADSNLAAAVHHIEEARAEMNQRRHQRKNLAPVREISPKKHRRKSRPQEPKQDKDSSS